MTLQGGGDCKECAEKHAITEDKKNDKSFVDAIVEKLDKKHERVYGALAAIGIVVCLYLAYDYSKRAVTFAYSLFDK